MGSTPTRGTIAVYLVIFVPELSIELPLALSSVSDIGRYQSKYRVYFKKFIESIQGVSNNRYISDNSRSLLTIKETKEGTNYVHNNF